MRKKKDIKLNIRMSWLITIVLVISSIVLIGIHCTINNNTQYIESMFGYNIFASPKSIIYSKGYPNSSAPYNIRFILQSSDFSENHQFSGFLSLQTNPIGSNDTKGYEYYDLVIKPLRSNQNLTYSSLFKGAGIAYFNTGSFKAMPFDKYYIVVTFFNTTIHHQTAIDQFFVSASNLPGLLWKSTDISVEASPQLTQFSITFEYSRTDISTIQNLSIPIILLGGLILTYISTSVIKTQSLDRDIKFRIDTSKWILAVGIANILLDPTVFGGSNVKSIFSVISLFLCIGYYFMSKYDDQEAITLINDGILGLSIIFLLIIVVLNAMY